MKIEFKAISYQDVKNGVEFKRDDYALAAYLSKTRINTFFANPNLADLTECLMSLELVDDVICGRSMLYPTKIKIDETISKCQSSSTLDVPEQFRSLGLGANLFYYLSRLTPYDYVICSGISDLALPLYKAMKYHILAFPRAMYINNARSILEHLGFKGFLLRVVSGTANTLLRLRTKILTNKSLKFQSKYKIVKDTVIPEWVDDMVLNDGHKYMECHDRTWMQWNLDYNFKGDKEDIQSFYSIYSEEHPVGFFMTKERFRKDAGGKLKNIILGAIVEWGRAKDSCISELDIYKIAFSTFSNNVDIIEFATDDMNVLSGMKRWGFVKHGLAHIAFKDKTKQYKDASDISLWRIRYGYADVILT